MASASCPASGGTDVSTLGFAAWHPVHDAAPGGASSTARARVVATQATMTRAKRRRAFTRIPPTAWESAARARSGGATGRRRHASNKGQTMVLQRDAAIALASGRRDGVEHRRRRHADGRLADAAPYAAS